VQNTKLRYVKPFELFDHTGRDFGEGQALQRRVIDADTAEVVP
jgi:hypothetical protein